MLDSEEDERYDTFEQYKSNEAILEQINKGVRGKNFSDIYNGSVNEDMENGRKIIEDSITLKRYLLHFNTTESCNKDNCYGYLNYWLNQKARKYSTSSNSILTLYSTYMNNDSELKQKNLCSSKIKHMSFDKYKKMDEIYKIYRSYKYYNLRKNHEQFSCSRANLCATEYNNILSKYPKIEDIKFCKVLENFKKEFEQNVLLPKKQCYPEIPNLVSYKDKCINLKSLPNGEDAHSQYKTNHEDPGEKSVESSYTQTQQIIRSTEGNNMPSSSLDATLPIIPFGSVIGLLFILLSLYKFTPFGKILKLQIQRFKGLTRNSDDELYEMQQNTSEYHDRNTEYNEYNISYNSL
ncbi:PIR Superfamily Protein [Plasmodium ovale wallikeri]|uniref:PIR Superfamily Protein n=1 Tax=Plasmodium ovale wallikeri TaxID=864142 RepID=A0A1A9A9Z6_PLAOA|nr:PIR Superfamily Protein [Plasmodium ovale wallikeri]